MSNLPPGVHIGAGGYLMTKVDGKSEYVHRLVFFQTHGYYPECVDHIDGDKLNNDPSNLRAANKSTNGLNRGKQSNNKSGYKGVAFCSDTGRWCARFRRKNLGRFNCRLAAYFAYCKASLAHNKEFHHG